MAIVAGNFGSILTNGTGRYPSGDPDFLEVMTEGWFSGGIISPTLISPLAGAIVSSPITFEWEVGIGVLTSQIQISSNSDFTDIIYEQSGLIEEEIEVNISSYNTGYYWRIRTTDGIDTSPWSDTRNLTTSTKPVILVRTNMPKVFFRGRR